MMRCRFSSVDIHHVNCFRLSLPKKSAIKLSFTSYKFTALFTKTYLFKYEMFFSSLGQYSVKDDLLHQSISVPFSSFKSRSKRQMAADPPAVSFTTTVKFQ